MSLLFLSFAVTAIVSVACVEQTLYGPMSSGADDDLSHVSCPDGTFGKKCECSTDWCDGAFFSQSNTCTAKNTFRKPGIKAVVTCDDLESLVTFTTEKTKLETDPVVACPAGTVLIHCGLDYPWMQDESEPYFDVITDRSMNQCTLGEKKCEQTCKLYAYCAHLEVALE